MLGIIRAICRGGSQISSEASYDGMEDNISGRKNEKIHKIFTHFLNKILHKTYQMKE